jgi:formylglycine-generating enzyme required for sulfatase activity
MRRLLQHHLHRCLLVAGLAAALASLPSDPRATQAAEDPPKPPADFKPYKETMPGSAVSFDMIPIPGGTYVMGSPDTEKGRAPDEGPQHPVTIRPFWMGKTEVTWDEFDVYFKKLDAEQRGDKPSPRDKDADAVSRPTPPYADETFGHGREGQPVLCITHHAAMEYCRWLSAKTGKTYRLPTEAEWEYACRAGTKTAYSFGDDPKQLGDYAWFKGNSDEMTHKVAQKKPNPWGLYDMHGNVAEWCLDHYKADYYSTFPTDKPALWPVLLPTATRFSHVARGGAWSDDPAKLRSAARRGSDKTWIKRDPQRPQSIWWLTDAEFVGFRVVRPLEEQDNLKGYRSLTTRESQ